MTWCTRCDLVSALGGDIHQTVHLEKGKKAHDVQILLPVVQWILFAGVHLALFNIRLSGQLVVQVSDGEPMIPSNVILGVLLELSTSRVTYHLDDQLCCVIKLSHCTSLYSFNGKFDIGDIYKCVPSYIFACWFAIDDNGDLWIMPIAIFNVITILRIRNILTTEGHQKEEHCLV